MPYNLTIKQIPTGKFVIETFWEVKGFTSVNKTIRMQKTREKIEAKFCSLRIKQELLGIDYNVYIFLIFILYVEAIKN